MNRLRVIVVARLDDAKLASKLEPLVGLPEVGEVVVIRRKPLPLPGVRSLCPPAVLARHSASAEPWRLARLLSEAARDRRSTVLVSFFLMPHAIHIDVARRLLGLPTIPVLLGDEDVVRAETSRYFRGLLLAAHAVGVRGPRSLQRLVALGLSREKVFAPPNVHDISAYVPDPSVPMDVDVVFVGQFYVSKRLDVLLEAVARVKARRGAVRVALVGDGRDRPAVERQIGALGLGPDVTLTGTLPPAEVAAWLRRSRLFVMTSEQEGLPMAMIEALSCGVPVVIGDIGDVTTVASDGENAVIVRPWTAAAFADAMASLLDDEPRRQRLAEGARRTRRRFEQEYSLEAARAAWRPVLRRLEPAGTPQ
jgi:glycosyltransferase involved in cell wall biosynthesis